MRDHGSAMAWRTQKKCAKCPFSSSGPGFRLRKSLRPGRWAEILASLRSDAYFPCHQTTTFDDDGECISSGKELLCAGAIEWQLKHNGQPSQLARIMERINGSAR